MFLLISLLEGVYFDLRDVLERSVKEENLFFRRHEVFKLKNRVVMVLKMMSNGSILFKFCLIQSTVHCPTVDCPSDSRLSKPGLSTLLKTKWKKFAYVTQRSFSMFRLSLGKCFDDTLKIFL